MRGSPGPLVASVLRELDADRTVGELPAGRHGASATG